ncbi:hypothetical protein LCGC14_0111870 [marine sediment metagenome]|uniref:Uncharacterized protein n=2 Tax=root TaxID=1 RepID=A0A7V1FMB8_9RHOB|nr:hypothetical protein [Sulfitobacter litoralis]HDZ51543.1 hypothetical protein [Sulfitobacter litoralis]
MSNFPPSVSRALVSTSEWLKVREPWVVKGAVQPLSMRLQQISVRAFEASLKTDEFPKRARRDIIQIVAYLPPDVRMGFLLAMARSNGEVLDEIVAGKYDNRSEPSRYNIYATIGSFARRALLADVFSEDRIERIEKILNDRGPE